jgi:hypothetical protein
MFTSNFSFITGRIRCGVFVISKQLNGFLFGRGSAWADSRFGEWQLSTQIGLLL